MAMENLSFVCTRYVATKHMYAYVESDVHLTKREKNEMIRVGIPNQHHSTTLLIYYSA